MHFLRKHTLILLQFYRNEGLLVRDRLVLKNALKSLVARIISDT
jgi:hypothetical protein